MVNELFNQQKIVSSLIFLFILTTVAPLGASADVDARQVMQSFIADPAFIRLGLAPMKNGAGSVETSVRLFDESLYHSQGVFWMSNFNEFHPFGGEYPNVSLYGKSKIRVLDSRYAYYGVEASQAIASRFAKTHFSWFFALGSRPKLLVQEPGKDGLWTFEWQQPGVKGEEELFSANTQIQVRAMDGRVVSFGAAKMGGWIEHKIKIGKAKSLALRIASRSRSYKNIQVKSLKLSYIPSYPEVVWQIDLQAANKNSRIVKSRFYLDAMTGTFVRDYYSGKSIEDDIVWRMTPEAKNSLNVPIIERLPTWVNQKLVFVANRHLANMPIWAEFGPQLIVQDAKGIESYLSADLASSPDAVTGLPNSSWIGIERSGWTYALNCDTGSYRILGHPGHQGLMPAIRANDLAAVVSGTGHDSNTDTDILTDNLQRGAMIEKRGRILLPQSEEHHAIFSSNGKWLYFISDKAETGKHLLLRIKAELASASILKTLPADEQETIAEVPADVQRISTFSNGNLLLQTASGIFIVSTEKGKCKPVIFKGLTDKELGLPIQDVRDGWAGPTDHEVTFSGKTTSKNRIVRWRIYSCNLNSSGIQARTSVKLLPVKAKSFLVKKFSAIDLAKTWASKEVEMYKEQTR